MSLLRLKEIIKSKKEYSGKDLAEDLDVSVNTVSNWSKGHNTPSGDDLLRIAKALDVDVRDLFHSTKTKEADEVLKQAINDLQVVYSKIKK